MIKGGYKRMKNVKNMYKKCIKFSLMMICLITSFLFVFNTSVKAWNVAGYYADWRFEIYTKRYINS